MSYSAVIFTILWMKIFVEMKNRDLRPVILPLISAAVIPTPIVFIFFVIIFSQIMWKNGQYSKYYKKIEILQYPDADAEEKFLLNLEGRKGRRRT